MSKPSKNSAVLVKKSAVAVAVAPIVNRNLNIDEWDAWASDMRLSPILYREGRVGIQRGIPIDTVKRAIKAKTLAKQNEIETEDAARRKAKEREEAAKKAEAEKAAAEIAEWERLASLSDALEQAESKEDRIKILAQISGRKASTRKASTSSTRKDGEPSIIDRIRALLPAKRSEIVNALSDLKSSYVNHYLNSYSGTGHAANGKNGILVNKVSDKSSPDDLFYL